MSFGQSASPASHGQLRELLSLVQAAGHTDFRDARGPLGLTQRQAGGKFSRDEATALIDLLTTAAEADDSDPGASAAAPDISGRELAAEARLLAERLAVLRGMPADLLAGELQRRGWIVAPGS